MLWPRCRAFRPRSVSALSRPPRILSASMFTWIARGRRRDRRDCRLGHRAALPYGNASVSRDTVRVHGPPLCGHQDRGDTRVRSRSCVFYNLFTFLFSRRGTACGGSRAASHRGNAQRASICCRARAAVTRVLVSQLTVTMCYAVSRTLENASVYRVLGWCFRLVCWLCAFSILFCTLSHYQNVIDLNLLCRNRVVWMFPLPTPPPLQRLLFCSKLCSKLSIF